MRIKSQYGWIGLSLLFVVQICWAENVKEMLPPGLDAKAYCRAEDQVTMMDSLGTVIHGPEASWLVSALNGAVSKAQDAEFRLLYSLRLNGKLRGGKDSERFEELMASFSRDETFKTERCGNLTGRRSLDWEQGILRACLRPSCEVRTCFDLSIEQLLSGRMPYRADEPSYAELSANSEKVSRYVMANRSDFCKKVLGKEVFKLRRGSRGGSLEAWKAAGRQAAIASSDRKPQSPAAAPTIDEHSLPTDFHRALDQLEEDGKRLDAGTGSR